MHTQVLLTASRPGPRLALLLLATLAWPGCEAPPPPAVGELSEGLFANDKTAYDFFVGKGLTNFQAAGIVGNLDQESGVDPTAVQFGGGPGRGIAQWSVGGRWDTSNNDNVQLYAKQQGLSATSLTLQLEFIWYELTTFGYGFAKLKATNNLTDATVAFQTDYEICGQCAQAQRIAYAQAVLNAYGAAPDYAAKYVSQSWPLASSALTIHCGEDVPVNIVLKNVGAKTWDTNTKLGTTQPRDRASIFVAADWLSASRASHVTGTVAPNANFQFNFTFHGPTGKGCVPGDYMEYFNLVQEGVAWFSDQGQGGPADNNMEAWIKLIPAVVPPDMATEPPADLVTTAIEDLGRAGAGDLASHSGDGGNAGNGGRDAIAGSDVDLAGQFGVSLQSGCSVAGRGRTSPAAVMFILLLAGLWRRGLRRSRRGAAER